MLGKDGTLVFVDIKVKKALERLIETLAEDPNNADLSSRDVAKEFVVGVEKFLRMKDLEQMVQNYFELHRGERK